MTAGHVRELITINRSLLALGGVIDALAGASAGGGAASLRVPPYRDSVLTVRGDSADGMPRHCMPATVYVAA